MALRLFTDARVLDDLADLALHRFLLVDELDIGVIDVAGLAVEVDLDPLAALAEHPEGLALLGRAQKLGILGRLCAHVDRLLAVDDLAVLAFDRRLRLLVGDLDVRLVDIALYVFFICDLDPVARRGEDLEGLALLGRA